MKKRGLIVVLLLVVFGVFMIKWVYAQEEVYLTSAMHLGVNQSQVFSLDGNYYAADMKDSSKNFYLNFSGNLMNNTALHIYAKQSKGIAVGIYDLSDISGTNPLGIFVVTSLSGEWYNVTLNINNLTNAIWFGEGTGSGVDPKEDFDYIYATLSDTTPPLFSNYTENPANNSAYVQGQTYKFNVTINETNINSVWIEFNGTNYTSVSNISKVYTFNRTNLAAGTYFYKWWANDTLGNINNSGIKSYITEKADNTLILLSSAGWDYNYGIESTFSCSVISGYGTPKLYIDNIEVSNPITKILSSDSYFIKCNISESQNYTGSDGMYQGVLTVNKASSQTSLTFNKTSPQIYGTSITPSCSVISGVGTANLTLNGSIINQGQALVPGAGTWNFNCSLSESQNYTSSSNFSQFTINPNSTTTNVIVNPSSGINYGAASNFSCLNSLGLETILYINGVDESSEKGLDIIRAAGTYIINCSFAGNQNYSASSEQTDYNINKTLGNITLLLNGQENNITIDYPQQYNITSTTLYGIVVIYFNGTDITSDNGLNATPTKNAGYYNITAVSSGDENHSSATITKWLNVTLDIVAPELQIISPQEGGSYGYNTSLPLNFSVSDQHLDSCWYNLDNGANVTAINCENTTFDAGSDESYTLYLYANDSLGNLAVKNSSFAIAIGSPTIMLNSPIGIYLNNQDVTFRYTSSDSDLQSCELWGNFDGEFKLNQTDISPTNNTENTFALNLPDGAYIWNIKCNDCLGHSVFNGNKTFYVDTIAPTITITNPTGTKTSRTGIPIQFLIIDASPATCRYNVKYTTGQEVLGNTTINCSSTSFGVSTDGDYILTFYVKDFANNLNSASSSFSVDTSASVSPPSGGGGGGGGGSGSSAFNTSQSGKLSVSQLGSIIAHQGDKKTLSLNVKNTGKIFLNNCRLIAKGDIISWIYSSQKQGIAPGENIDFNFDLNIPEEIEKKDYNGELEVKCDEGNDVQIVVVSIPGLGSITIKNISQEKDILRINYDFDSSNFIGEETSVDIWIVNNDGIEVKRVQDSFPVNKDGATHRILEIDASDLSGIYDIYFALSDNLNNFIRQSVVLGKSGVTGFVVFDTDRGKLTIYIIFLAIIAIAIFFIWKRHGKAETPKNNGLLRKKAAITAAFLIPLLFIIGFNNNLTGFAVNNPGSFNKNIFGAAIFVFAVSATLLILQKRKSCIPHPRKSPFLRDLINKPVYTSEGEFLGKIKDIILDNCKIEKIQIKLNFKNRKKFNKKIMLAKYNVIDKIGDIVILRNF